MKYALVNEKKTEASQGLIGICPVCDSKLFPKCGTRKIHHWAHKGIRNCDTWWEPETEWHRNWKNNFPLDWQEKVFFEKFTNEKHIADVYTMHNLVIEFQHSYIDTKERIKREAFYKNMVWVVDGSRLKRDYSRFLRGKENFISTNEPGIYLLDFPEDCFPSTWIDNSVPVIFDFKDIETDNNVTDWSNYLYYLFPKKNLRESMVAKLTRESFVNNIIEGKWFQQQKEFNSSMPTIQTKANVITNQRPSQYVYDRGRFVKRRRW
jgi:hypothetical protein